MAKLNGFTVPTFMVIFLIGSFVSYGKLSGAVDNNSGSIDKNTQKIELLICQNERIARVETQIDLQKEDLDEIQNDIKALLRKIQ